MIPLYPMRESLNMTHTELSRGHSPATLTAPICSRHRCAIEFRWSLVEYWQQLVCLCGQSLKIKVQLASLFCISKNLFYFPLISVTTKSVTLYLQINNSICSIAFAAEQNDIAVQISGIQPRQWEAVAISCKRHCVRVRPARLRSSAIHVLK